MEGCRINYDLFMLPTPSTIVALLNCHDGDKLVKIHKFNKVYLASFQTVNNKEPDKKYTAGVFLK